MILRSQLIGSWRPVLWEWSDATGLVDSPLGEHPIGLLMYDDANKVSVQLMRPNQKHFADEDWRRATAEEKAIAWSAYFCYFGDYTIDEEAGTVTHFVEGSWFPNLVGTTQIRRCTLSGDQLSLVAETPWGRVLLKWQKIR